MSSSQSHPSSERAILRQGLPFGSEIPSSESNIVIPNLPVKDGLVVTPTFLIHKLSSRALFTLLFDSTCLFQHKIPKDNSVQPIEQMTLTDLSSWYIHYVHISF